MTNVHSPSFPHGTPAGFDAGCRSAACSGAYLSGITCRDAKRRYVGDWTFRRRVDAGMTPRDIVQLEAAEAEAETLARVAARAAALAAAKAEAKAAKAAGRTPRIPKVKTSKPRRTIGAYAPDGKIHGSLTGYRNGCTNPEMCPGPSLGVPTCTEAARKRRREDAQAWRDRHRDNPRPAAKHGTSSGYQRFKCRSRTDCPAVAEGGISCGQAKYEYEKTREARKAA
jgi:hypothetical protein